MKFERIVGFLGISLLMGLALVFVVVTNADAQITDDLDPIVSQGGPDCRIGGGGRSINL